MNIVSFFAPRLDHPNYQNYAPYLAVLEASCRRFGHTHIVLTDAALDMPFRQFITPLPAPLMQANLAAHLAYLKSPLAAYDTVLVGADCALAGDPITAFDGGFDLGVTTHPFGDCWLNTGAIFVPGGASVSHIWERALTICGTAWGDDQLSLAKALAPVLLEHGDYDRAERRVRFMPVDPWNLAPERQDDDCSRARILHFRGNRKNWMADYCRRWLKLEPVEIGPWLIQ